MACEARHEEEVTTAELLMEVRVWLKEADGLQRHSFHTFIVVLAQLCEQPFVI